MPLCMSSFTEYAKDTGTAARKSWEINLAFSEPKKRNTYGKYWFLGPRHDTSYLSVHWVKKGNPGTPKPSIETGIRNVEC